MALIKDLRKNKNGRRATIIYTSSNSLLAIKQLIKSKQSYKTSIEYINVNRNGEQFINHIIFNISSLFKNINKIILNFEKEDKSIESITILDYNKISFHSDYIDAEYL